MKKTQIILAALAAISTAHFASAQTSVVITGSTAFRASASNAIRNVFTASGNSLTGYAYSGTSFTGATYQTFVGNISGMSNPVTVKTQWTGAVAGINAVSNQATVNVSVLPDTQPISSGGTSGASITSNVSAKADIGFADNLQSSTAFTTNALAQEKVGIIPFAWVAGKDAIPGITNITHQMARSLLTNGVVRASQFTGVATDSQTIYAGGRDNLSGTRVTTLAELGYGTQNGVTQFKPATFGTGTSANVVSTIDIQTLNGNNGETSGGTLANYARYTTNTASDVFNGVQDNPAFIIYVGEADSYAAVYGVGGGVTGNGAGNGRYLTYNGVKAFDGVAKSPASVTTTAGSPILTGLTDTTGVIAGQIVSGNNIAGGSVVVSTTSTTITLDKNVLAGGTTTNARIGALIASVVREGAYPFWNYEYVNYLASRVNSASGTEPIKSKGVFKNLLAGRVSGFDYGFSGLADDASFKVARGEDGGVLTAK